jgi:hypothetical protein
MELHIVRQRAEPLGRALDLGHARQESEHAAILLAQGAADRLRHGILHPQIRRSAEIAHF